MSEEMKLTEEESKHISALHRQASDIIQAIGQEEVRKAKLMSQLADIEERAQGVMNSVGARLQIPAGTPWQVKPDGTVTVIDVKTGQPVAPPSLHVVPPPSSSQ